jgi:hypothetical protein
MKRGGVAVVLVVAGCGSRTGFEALPERSPDGSVPAPISRIDAGAGSGIVDASAPWDARVIVDGGVAGDAAASVDAADCTRSGCDAGPQPFSCGTHVCTSDEAQYCVAQYPGCGWPGQACKTNWECCEGRCVSGICGGPDSGSPQIDFHCADLPPDCRTFPPSCACVIAHDPCGPGIQPFPCTVDGGVLSISCLGI